MYFRGESNKARVGYLIQSAAAAIILHVCVLMISIPVQTRSDRYDSAQSISVSLYRESEVQSQKLPDETPAALDESKEVVPEPIITNDQIKTDTDASAEEDQPDKRLRVTKRVLIPSESLSPRSVSNWAGQYVKNQLRDSEFRSFDGSGSGQNSASETRPSGPADLDTTNRVASMGFSEVSVKSGGKQRCFRIFEPSGSYSDFDSPSLALPIKCNDQKKPEFNISRSSEEP